ncbi:inositol/phosphatidylinositol kinase [Cryptococcus neoformans]|nr:inositol/phosphatidylinositol kinase [Cryptococcus neoformans var. grubii Th84]OXH15405.1 inositol/phosphatidylinositol kinase [Cryptococcus neoformans var. grubii]OXH35842.1 inositol/phosphatidylinositol kinase [Cryptococcus neoformans var. grubii]OXH56316.1 inositol/phosphatidylinositol kinase [Cryptococcus neoformans var. grubii]OXH56425.1 inositol/phosphatidylinositol kinase [Cryptococcus neoformans var. grubii]
MDSNQCASQASGSQQFPLDARSAARFHLQAAGHDGTIDTSLDHRNVYKPTTQEEIQFYENINDSDFLIEHPGLVKIKPFIPAYKGCVDRSSYTRSDDSMQIEVEEEVPVYGEGGEVVGYKENTAKKHTHSIVLSNLLYELQNPTVADFKLGKRWWGSGSGQAKRFRHDKSCAATTSSATGILFAGAHVSYIRSDLVRVTNCWISPPSADMGPWLRNLRSDYQKLRVQPSRRHFERLYGMCLSKRYRSASSF